MGNTLTIEENQVTKKRNGQWRVRLEGSGCNIVESQSGIHADQYRVPLDQKSWELNNIKIFQFRRVQNSHLVRVHNVEADSNTQTLAVRTEMIKNRLTDLTDLTPDEALYVSLYSLIGFRYVYELCQKRLFSVNDSMIAFTPEGNVKVWINGNFALNELDIVAFKANPVKTETDLVNLIFNTVARHSRGGRLPQRFLLHYNSKPVRSISDTLRCFKSFLQSENVSIANRVDLTTRAVGSIGDGYFQKVEANIQKVENVRSVQNNINGINGTEQKILGHQYAGNTTYQLPHIQQQKPQIPNIQQQQQQPIQRQTQSIQEGTRSVYSDNIGIVRHSGHPQSPLSQIRQSSQIMNHHPFGRNPYEQQQFVNSHHPLDPRIARTSTLSYAQRSPVQSQIYTRQGTNNFPIPSNAINHINLQKKHSGSLRPHYHHQIQPRVQRTPVAQAKLAPAIGSTTKVIGVQRFDNFKVQEGVVNETVLKTEKQIYDAMNPQVSLNNVYLNPKTNQTAKIIEIENLEEIKKHRSPTENDFISGQNRNLSFVNPQIQKLMMLPNDRTEQVYFNSLLNNVPGLVQSTVLPSNPHPNLFMQQTHSNNFTRVPDQRSVTAQRKISQSNLSYQNRSNYSSLSKRSNRSFKADKLVLMGGKAVSSGAIEITEVNSQNPAQRTETTVYHQISSFGLNPTIKQESPYSYSAYEQVPLSIPKSPYRQNIHTQIIQQQYTSTRYR